jgi:PAS domain S-box-containing protein
MRILVADDHELVRRGICSILGAESTLTICGEAIDGRDAVEKAKALRPDVIVMDISMPRLNGLEAIREIKSFLPQVEIVIVSQHAASQMIRQGFNAGARGYVLKSSISADLLAAVAKVSRHETFASVEGQSRTSGALDAEQILQQSAAFEKALRESEERFRSAMNNMAEGLIIVDTEGKFTYANPAAEAMVGWTSAELAGKKMHEALHYKHADGTPFPASKCPALQAIEKGVELREHEDAFVRKDGSVFPVIYSAATLKNEGKVVGLVSCFRDDTKRHQAEEGLRQNERIYRAIGESIDYGIWICDAAGKNIYASPSFLNLIGQTQAQCSELGWTRALHPEDADGTIAAWNECVRTGTFWEREHRFRGSDGRWHDVLARGVPVRDSHGEILRWVGINLDIQRRKDAERDLHSLVQSLEARISDRTRELENATEKLRELSGTLLQTQDEERRRIARELHDGVGQLLAAMNMNLSTLVQEGDKLSADARRSLEENASLLEQASQEIRTMSHLLHPPLLDEVGLESAVRWFIDGFSERSKIAVKIELSAGFSKGLPRDLALSLFRIVQECLTNVHRHSESATALVSIARSAGEITLEVQDDGGGIAPEIQARIASGVSPGVGLRGIRERVRQFGGRLEVASNPSGTRIAAVLPVPDFEEQTEPEIRASGNGGAGRAAAPRSRDTSTILCIDDETSGLLPRKLLLESAGHRVLEARSGEEGIRLFQSEKVAAVILDYWMSGMKGTAVASELKRIDPSVPIIVLSGMSDLPGEATGVVDQWIMKGSIRAAELLDSIHSLLERRSV